MSDQPQQPVPQPEPTPQQEPSAVHNGQDTTQLFHQICDALDTERASDEGVEEFKIRVVTEFSDMTVWPDSRYETLSEEVQNWVYEATTVHKANTNKKRKKPLPELPGLDPIPAPKLAKIRRASLVDEPKRGRTRGEDCLTRTMKILLDNPEPEKVKAQDLVKMLEAQYGKAYSTAAVRYAQQAFTTARGLLTKTPA
jgi:hypothetical protein